MQDYILKRQNERIAEQKKELQEQSIQYVGLLEDCRNQRDEYAELFNQAIRQSEEILKNNEKTDRTDSEIWRSGIYLLPDRFWNHQWIL